ncbi:RNA-binding S4 domain-containing protein [Sphingobacteriales bacterium CHB3]|nr:RNA-binding S4 domain-containing protein [Sphingobacteriales bacterium CHB3]
MAESEQTIQLDQFLKWKGLVSTGGQAKIVIQSGEVLLNGVVETRRKKKLKPGDRVTYAGRTLVVNLGR